MLSAFLCDPDVRPRQVSGRADEATEQVAELHIQIDNEREVSKGLRARVEELEVCSAIRPPPLSAGFVPPRCPSPSHSQASVTAVQHERDAAIKEKATAEVQLENTFVGALRVRSQRERQRAREPPINCIVLTLHAPYVHIFTWLWGGVRVCRTGSVRMR